MSYIQVNTTLAIDSPRINCYRNMTDLVRWVDSVKGWVDQSTVQRIVYEFPADPAPTWREWRREGPAMFHTQITQVIGTEPQLYRAVLQRSHVSYT